MRHCENCGQQLPEDARFCGNCGWLTGNPIDMPTHDPSSLPTGLPPALADVPTRASVSRPDWVSGAPPSPPATPPSISGSSFPGRSSGQHEDWIPTFVQMPAAEQFPKITLSGQGKAEQGQSQPIFPDAMTVAGAVVGVGMNQAPAGQAPLVLGAPQASDVPLVQGASPHHAPERLPKHHRARQAKRLVHHGRHRLLKWGGASVGGMVVIASVIAALLYFMHPGLSIGNTAGGAVTAPSGGTLPLHGTGFVPGNSVSFTLDNGIPVSPISYHPTRGANAVAAVVLMAEFAPTMTFPWQPADSGVQVGWDGTFNTAIGVNASWSIGPHTIHARERFTSRSADLLFRIVPMPSLPAHLLVSTSSLDFGKIAQGSKVALSVVLKNAGGSPLTWMADTVGATWLKLDTPSGTLQPKEQHPLYITADTTALKMGSTNMTTLHITSNGGNAQVAVTLGVTPPTTVPSAKLDVAPPSLDFGQLTAGNTASGIITIANRGTADLTWTADVGNATWVTLDITANTVHPAGLPQTIQVTVDTKNLAAGPQKATISIHSNGGDASIPVMLTVASQTTSPAALQVSPATLSYSFTDVAATNAQTVTVANTGGFPLNWTAALATPALTDVSVSLTKNLGTNVAGGASDSFDVTVSALGIPRTETLNTSVTVTATDPVTGAAVAGSPQTVSIMINIMGPPPPPSPSPSPPPGIASLGTCSYAVGSGWSCPLTLTADAGNQGDWVWTATGSGINGITINPASSPLPPGQTTTATVSIPDSVCPAQASINVFDPVHTLPALPWSCAAPTMSVTPARFSQFNCTGDSTNGWTCANVVTLTESSQSQGGLAWTASSANGASVSFSPQSNLVPGQPLAITITIPASDCHDTFTFSVNGGGSAGSVIWVCDAIG